MCLTYESLFEHHSETRIITVTLLLPEYVIVTVDSDPTEIPFKMNGVELTTPAEVKATPGSYTFVFPKTFQGLNFVEWEDKSTDPTRKVDLKADIELFASYKKKVNILPWVGAVVVLELLPLAFTKRR